MEEIENNSLETEISPDPNQESNDNSQDLGGSEISATDLLYNINQIIGDDHTNVSKEVTDETFDDDDKKLNVISETVENKSNFNSSTSIDNSMVLQFSGNFEETNIKEEDLAVPIEFTAENVDEVDKFGLGNIDNLSNIIEREIIAYKAMNQSTSLDISKISDEEDKKAKDSLSETVIKTETELSQISNSNMSPQHVTDDSVHVHFNHGLNKPDMMLEIPTQDFIDVDDGDVSMNLNDENQVDLDGENLGIRENNISTEIEISTETKSHSITEIEHEVDNRCKPNENVDTTENQHVKEAAINIEIHNADKSITSNSNISDLTVLNKDDCKEKKTHSSHKVNEVYKENTVSAISKQAEETKPNIDIPVVGEINLGLQQDKTNSDRVSINLDDTLNKPVHNIPNEEISLDLDQSARTTLNVSEESPKSDKNIDIETAEITQPLTSNNDIEEGKANLYVDNSKNIDLQIKEDESKSMEVVEESTNKNGIKNKSETKHTKSTSSEGNTEVTLSREETSCDKNTEAVDTEMEASTTKDTNKLTPDTADEAPEVSDSLGLLAESTRVTMEDDEYQEEEDEEDDEFYPDDESSNQMTAEHSEDSNAHHSETDACRERENKSNSDDGSFQFKLSAGPLESIRNKAVDDDKKVTQFCDKEKEETSVEEVAQNDNVQASLENEQDLPKSKEIETVKPLDISENEGMVDDVNGKSKDSAEDTNNTDENKLDSRQKSTKRPKLEISHVKHIVNIVDLEESSSEDDIQEIKKDDVVKADEPTKPIDDTVIDTTTDTVMVDADDVTTVNSANEAEIAPEEDNDAQVVDKGEEVELSDEPEACPEKPVPAPNTSKPKIGLEIFNLDSDDEEDNANTAMKSSSSSPRKLTAVELEAARGSNQCVNYACPNGAESVEYVRADSACLTQFASRGDKNAVVCSQCAELVAKRTRALVDGIKNMTPLLELDMVKLSQDLVEISDSESEDEAENRTGLKAAMGEEDANHLESFLRNIINDTWIKYKMDSRLRDAHLLINEEVRKLEKQKMEVDQLLADCQTETDKVRNDLYATFEPQREELPSIIIYDTPNLEYSSLEEAYDSLGTLLEDDLGQPGKRRYSGNNGSPTPKRPAIPLGYTPLDPETQPTKQDTQEIIPLPPIPDLDKINEDKDVAVVQLSVESAPAGLPPPGEPQRPSLKVGMPVFAMRNSFGTWLKGKILECHQKSTTSQFTVCRVKFDHKLRNPCKMLPARCIAYSEPSEVRMTIGTRVISLFKNPANTNNKKESYYSGIVAEVPNPVNNYRYLVFFDDGYAQYAMHSQTRLVCESSVPVWDEVHPFSREFVRDYLIAYPERPMVRLHAGQRLKTEWNGKWWSSKVLSVDASLVKVHFEEDNRTEWIYRGSTRLAPLYLELQAAVRHRPRPLPRSKAQTRSNMPYVEYTRSEEQATSKETERQTQQQQQEEIRRQRAVAKKSTVAGPPPVQPYVQNNMDTVTSRVVYYTPKNAVKPYKMVPHTCGLKCKRTDVLALKDLRTYNPLAKPLLSGWERQIVRYKGTKEVTYRAPCGRRVRNMPELHRYLRIIRSDMPVDLFDFHSGTHCLAEFVLNKCIVGKKDLSHGKENVPVPCVNYYNDSLPEFCSYNTERTPTAGVPLNLDPAFLCGCDCTDDCQDKTKCSCWKMTLEGARTIGLTDPNVGYVYKRLPEPLPSGIYECNSRCKCKHTCLNRVAQHPLQLKLQVFKTLNRGWGIRALNDVPKGSFLCVYAGNLLTDATANLDGLNEGDEYLAELDYIEVVEQMKEGYEEDIPDADKKLDEKESSSENTNEEDSPSSEDENVAKDDDDEDADFAPGYIGLGDLKFNKRLRARGKEKKDTNENANEKEKEKESQKESNAEEDCITISDDEEVREPSRFAAQAGMGANEFISKYRSVRSYFGKDEACYIMDAKVQGNIGRYLNHSCSPNVFVQNVFVDTHDPRFPWVAFFALSHIRAGTELTWNYNYDIGSVPEKVLYCFCGAPNCRGRLL